MGADRLYAELERACGGDGRVTVEPVYCLGNCALSPSVMVDGELHGRMDERKVLDLVRAP
jgi:formate dehydrogenase subunit gamma